MSQLLSKQVHKKVKDASRYLGISEKDFIRQALTSYLDNLASYLSLQKELKAWDRLSEEAFIRFEKSL